MALLLKFNIVKLRRAVLHQRDVRAVPGAAGPVAGTIRSLPGPLMFSCQTGIYCPHVKK
jgi:hypothetical protein